MTIFRELRLKRKISLRKFAKLVGLCPAFVSEVERGKVSPYTTKTTLRVATALNLNRSEAESILIPLRKKCEAEIASIDSFLNGLEGETAAITRKRALGAIRWLSDESGCRVTKFEAGNMFDNECWIVSKNDLPYLAFSDEDLIRIAIREGWKGE